MRSTVRVTHSGSDNASDRFNPKSRAFEALRLLTAGPSAGRTAPAKGIEDACHRVALRLQLVTTANSGDTEEALSSLLPRAEAVSIQRLLSELGSSVCTERTPGCSACPLSPICPRLGVSDSR